jgi:hypothetical protein
METHGARHRISGTTLPGGGILEGIDEFHTYAAGRKVTNKRVQQPRNLMFDKEHGHDPKAPKSPPDFRGFYD